MVDRSKDKDRPQRNAEAPIAQHAAGTRRSQGSLGASPKWILEPARPFRLGFGGTNFRCGFCMRSPSVCLTPSSWLAAGAHSGGCSAPLHSRPRKAGRLQNPLRPAGPLGNMGLEEWPWAKDLRLFFGGGKKVTRGIEMQPIQRDAELRSAPPYNNGFEQSARGRHSPCLRKACAGALRPAMAGLRPCSLLNPALYGRNQSQELKRSMQSGKESIGLRLGGSDEKSSQRKHTSEAVEGLR